jgi:lysophospholipase L1-like esterase
MVLRQLLRPILISAAAAALVLTADTSSLAQETVPLKVVPSVDYVALGDSYSAGPFVGTQRADPAGCLRSHDNYPAFLAGYLGVTTYRDVTCSGARVRDFSQRQSLPLGGSKPPPQLAALSTDTDLVTVGIGGNDFGLFSSLTGECSALAAQHPKASAPCRKHFTNAHGVNTKFRDAERIQQHVAAGLKEIHQAAPNAQVVVVGYPRLLPSHGTCSQAPFAKGDYPFARRVEHLLNVSLERAAGHHRAMFVGTFGVSKGHDICAGADAWINGSTPQPGVAFAYHPFESGERGMARRVFHVLTGDVAPPGGDATPPPDAIICNPETPPVLPPC